ncbi:Zona pellucida-like domain family protein [Brugia pahangi]
MIFAIQIAITVCILPNFISTTYYDNSIVGVPKVQCMEDRMKLTFHTAKPFTGRVFVKGMVDKDQCVNSFIGNRKLEVQYEIINGQCNMRRSRKIGPELKGIEQSITIIVSFHDTFTTKIDRAFRCTCFYFETDRVVTVQFDVSMIPTTDLIDTARMPLCTYTVRRDSITGKTVSFATIGEPVIHVWRCESDMFSILVHSCFVDDGNGREKKLLIDERGCAIEPAIIPDLTYNENGNMAFSKVNVFKFADKLTTYFQCAVSTCMRSEGRCNERIPPFCANDQIEYLGSRIAQRSTNANTTELSEKTTKTIFKYRKLRSVIKPMKSFLLENQTLSKRYDEYTMDLSADKIVVLDLDEERPNAENSLSIQLENEMSKKQMRLQTDGKFCLNSSTAILLNIIICLSFAVLIGGFIRMLWMRKMADKLSL